MSTQAFPILLISVPLDGFLPFALAIIDITHFYYYSVMALFTFLTKKLNAFVSHIENLTFFVDIEEITTLTY